MLDLDALRPPPEPRDATTIIWLRDREGALEVLAVSRSKESRFLGGAVVFPGGRLDAEDDAPEWEALVRPPSSRGLELARDAAQLRALAVAGCRESLEEVGIVPLASGHHDVDVPALRTAADRSSAALRSALADAGATLALDALIPFARWVTPEAESRRFDARFFLARAPELQTARHDDRETTSSVWSSPSALLALWERGTVLLAPPTHRTLEQLAAYTTVEEALAAAARACLDPICPKLVEHATATETGIALALPGDPAHDVRELRSPGKSRYVLVDGRFVPQDAPSR